MAPCINHKSIEDPTKYFPGTEENSKAGSVRSKTSVRSDCQRKSISNGAKSNNGYKGAESIASSQHGNIIKQLEIGVLKNIVCQFVSSFS